MDSQMANTIKQDFLAWSGGFPPESDDQIYVYIETAKRPEIDDEELRALLQTWMNGDDCCGPVT